VHADISQFETALINIAVNARDAMNGEGRLTISVTAQERLPSAPLPRMDGYVAVALADSGCGIPADQFDRIFEPFFTTKDVGRGTGLGLSMVYGFVKQSGGHVRIESEVGRGTIVTIFLPRFLARAELAGAEAAETVEVRGGSETILVCEDDDGVRAFSVSSLRELGYDVLEAANGETALATLAAHRDSVAMLFTDVVLPGGMMGSDLAARAHALRPDLKVLFTTGYARDAIVHHGRLDEGIDLVLKPFTFDDLALRVRAALDR
jgi:CheY-like chemotaxis protein